MTMRSLRRVWCLWAWLGLMPAVLLVAEARPWSDGFGLQRTQRVQRTGRDRERQDYGSSDPNQLFTDKDFDPFVDNGGTCVGIAGEDFCVIAADTRLSEGYFIRSRQLTRIYQIGDGMLMTGSGCSSDVSELSRVLQEQLRQYRWDTQQDMSLLAMTHLLSNILFSRRHFPYFSFSILGGLDEHGHGAVYQYDAVGSTERVMTATSGKGQEMIQPLLDELTRMNQDDGLWQFDARSGQLRSTGPKWISNITEEQALSLALSCFRAAAEREITIGDGVEICIIRRRSDRVERHWHPLPQH